MGVDSFLDICFFANIYGTSHHSLLASNCILIFFDFLGFLGYYHVFLFLDTMRVFFFPLFFDSLDYICYLYI